MTTDSKYAMYMYISDKWGEWAQIGIEYEQN